MASQWSFLSPVLHSTRVTLARYCLQTRLRCIGVAEPSTPLCASVTQGICALSSTPPSRSLVFDTSDASCLATAGCRPRGNCMFYALPKLSVSPETPGYLVNLHLREVSGRHGLHVSGCAPGSSTMEYFRPPN
ncbi:hypothetical protein EI94DRAFT_1717464 [Lactarius quietus]|nr:hypothetical protein EI94DRAFT_1717464 [Lactarius quietus]